MCNWEDVASEHTDDESGKRRHYGSVVVILMGIERDQSAKPELILLKLDDWERLAHAQASNEDELPSELKAVAGPSPNTIICKS